MNQGKYELYRAERDKGLSYREIAEKYGVTYQNVAIACGKHNPSRFRYHKENGVIYPNVRQWMNDNKISIAEALRRMGFSTSTNNSNMLSCVLRGKHNPRKEMIDKLIGLTGLTYEKLFEVANHDR